MQKLFLTSKTSEKNERKKKNSSKGITRSLTMSQLSLLCSFSGRSFNRSPTMFFPLSSDARMVCMRARVGVYGLRPIRCARRIGRRRRQGGEENRRGEKTFAYSKRKIVREVCGLLLRWNECVRGLEMTPFI